MDNGDFGVNLTSRQWFLLNNEALLREITFLSSPVYSATMFLARSAATIARRTAFQTPVRAFSAGVVRCTCLKRSDLAQSLA